MDPTLAMLSSVAGEGGGPSKGMAAIPELYKLGTGIGQTMKAKKFAKYDRPIYDVPQSFDEALGVVRSMAGSPYLPGQELMEDRLRGVTSRGVGAITQTAQDPASALAAVGGVFESEMAGVRDIGIEAAQDYQARQGYLADVLQQRAGYEDKKFDVNKMQLFDDAMAASRRLQETGQQNIFGGVSGLSEVLQSGSGGGGGNGGSQVPLDDIFGGATGTGTSDMGMAGKSLFEMKQSIGR